MKRHAVLMCLCLLLAPPVWGETYLVCPNPQQGDFPNIQAAVDAVVDGDIIELADGVFWYFGNWGIDWGGKEITIRSQSGSPEDCVIDGWAHAGMNLSGFYIHDVGPDAVLERVTIANGDASDGGGIHMVNASPRVTGCILLNNHAGFGGGIMCGVDAYPTITECRFHGNAGAWGGGIECDLGASPTIARCTFDDNYAGMGAGICI